MPSIFLEDRNIIRNEERRGISREKHRIMANDIKVWIKKLGRDHRHENRCKHDTRNNKHHKHIPDFLLLKNFVALKKEAIGIEQNHKDHSIGKQIPLRQASKN